MKRIEAEEAYIKYQTEWSNGSPHFVLCMDTNGDVSISVHPLDGRYIKGIYIHHNELELVIDTLSKLRDEHKERSKALQLSIIEKIFNRHFAA